MCVPIAQHTHNRWFRQADGTEIISNAVYCFTCRWHKLSPQYACGKAPFVVEWRLTTNARVNLSKIQSATVYENAYLVNRRRRMPTAREAKNLVERLKKEFSDYFLQLCPPIPRELAVYFMQDGELPPPFELEGAPEC